MIRKTSPAEVASHLKEYWSPKVVAEVNDFFIKVAKVKNSFEWHDHKEEDELFFVLSGRLEIELEAGTLLLEAGEMTVVPKGMRHRPSAEGDCLILLLEKKTTLHTGDNITNLTRSIEEQLGS